MTKSSAVALLIATLAASAVLATEPQVFKNTDLEKYSSGNDTHVVETPQPDNSGQPPREAEDGGITSGKYWCDTATEADNHIRRAEEALANAQARKIETRRKLDFGNRVAAMEDDARASGDLESAEAELAGAKQQKERLQSEAHQKNIPAGWLRCQFE
jgi:hypothetical protein